jgi:hypothetical protein
MEEPIYTQAIARLKSADALAYYADKGVTAPKAYEWFQNQIEDALQSEKGVCPFDCPAVFFEFEPTNYERNNTVKQKAEGELIVHLAQFTFVDGREDALTHDEFKDLLKLADVIADLLSGKRLGCSAILTLTQIERDKTNRALMTDKIHFSWKGVRTRAAVPVVP